MVFAHDGRVATALVLDILGGLVVGVRVVTNPEKLERLSGELAAKP
jgi:hypothetical protein